MIKNVKVYKENGVWYLTVDAHVEETTGLYEIIAPKLRLCGENENLIIPRDPYGGFVYLGDHRYTAYKANITDKDTGEIYDDVYYIEKLIKPRVEKMTVEEIEKALGYKVEIVSEK